VALDRVKTLLPPCPECGERIEFDRQPDGANHARRGVTPVFCTPEHKRAWNNRQMSRAAPLMLLMQVWRKGRHKKGSKAAKIAFTELCLAIDAATSEDMAAGRPPAIEVYEARLRRQGLGGMLT
jgi:hypothetical protein